MNMELFKQEPLRLDNGRYCTKEQYHTARVESENKRLRYERDKYYRAWLSLSKRVSQLERDLKAVNDLIGHYG